MKEGIKVLAVAAAVVILVLAIFAIRGPVRSRAVASEHMAVTSLRTLIEAESAYRESNAGRYADIRALIGAGLLDSSYLGLSSGQGFSFP